MQYFDLREEVRSMHGVLDSGLFARNSTWHVHRRRRSLLAIVVLVAIVTVDLPLDVAAGDEPDQIGESPFSPAPAESVDTISTIRRNDLSKPDNPSKDGWSTEAISSAASKQLKKLGKLLAHPDQLTSDALTTLAAGDIVSSRLRPANVERVYADKVLSVDRARDNETSPEFEGRQGVVNAVSEMLAPFSSAESIRVEFKLFRIVVEDSEAVTHCYVQVVGPATEGTRQLNSVWRCRWKLNLLDVAPLLKSIESESFEEIDLQGRRNRLFSDCTTAVLGSNPCFSDQLMSGLESWRVRIEQAQGFSPAGFQGLAIADVNGDGLDDLYLCQTGGLPNRLFIQNSDGTATDTAKAAKVDWLDSTNSALFVDLDNDSDQDLILAMDHHLVFLSNDGQGVFRIERKRDLEFAGYSLSAADVENDGDLDIYVCHYSKSFTPMTSGVLFPVPWHDANNGPPNLFLRNDGGWNFVDATDAVGLNANNQRFSWTAAWEDYDNDGDQDLYVANDFGRNNLYRNDNGQFVDTAAAAGVEDISAGMSVSWGDYDGDGWMDLYVSNMFSAAGNRVTYQRQFKPGIKESELGIYQRHARGNSLFLNAGDGTFRDVSVSSGVTMGRWAWGSTFADINNDGRDDFYVANGFITGKKFDDL